VAARSAAGRPATQRLPWSPARLPTRQWMPGLGCRRSGEVRCGAAYVSGSYLCGACARSYYPWGDGSCGPCPSVTRRLGPRYGALVEAVLGAAAAACAVGLVLLWLVRTAGGTLWGSSRRFLDLVQWSMTALQTVSQAAPASSASLPAFLATLFRGLEVLRVKGVLLRLQRAR